MIAVIVLPGRSDLMHGLDQDRNISLLPLGDRPVLQHVIESLAAQEITRMEILVGHAPQQVETWFGSGNRWGCSIRYHLASQPDRPYRSLKVISETKREPWLLVHAERFPCASLNACSITRPLLYMSHVPSDPLSELGKSTTLWSGTALLPPGIVSEHFVKQNREELTAYLLNLGLTGRADYAECEDWIDASSPAALIRTQANLLGRQLSSLILSGREREPGVWVSRNVAMHRTARINAPVYIGPNCRIGRDVTLGPNLVLSGDCIVHTQTTIQHSIVTSGNYIGAGLELDHAIVDHNRLVNVRLEAGIEIDEGFLLGKLQQPLRCRWLERLTQSVLALLLIVLTSPVILVSGLYFGIVRRRFYTSFQVIAVTKSSNGVRFSTYSLLGIGEDAWSIHRRAGWNAFVRQFLPGLFGVLVGRLHFVGLTPRSYEVFHGMSTEWQSVYLGSKPGLITEASTAAMDPDDSMQMYLVEAYYAAKQSVWHDLRLVCRYFLRLIVSSSVGQSGTHASSV